jgi:hypothetical protein
MMSRDTPLYMQADTVVETVADMSVDSAATEVEGAVDLAGVLSMTLARLEADNLALRAEVAEGARREKALQVELAQALEGTTLAVSVFQKELVTHNESLKAAWEKKKTEYKAFCAKWAESKVDLWIADKEKCVDLGRKVERLEERAKRVALRGQGGEALVAPLCPICRVDLLDDMVALPCGHVLHAPCCVELQRASRAPTCPLCSQPLTRREVLPLFYSQGVYVGGGGNRDAPMTRARRRV